MHVSTEMADRVVPALMLGGAFVIALAQDAASTFPDSWTSLATAVVQALTVGGGLAVGGAFLLKRAGAYLDNRSTAEMEERALDRAERERQYSDHKDTTLRYISSLEARVSRTEDRYDRLVEVLMSKPTSPPAPEGP